MSSDKWVFITGSGGGIGKALVRRFIGEGYHIYAHLRSPREDFDRFILPLKNEWGKEIVPVYFDLKDTAAMEEVIHKMRKEKKTVDVLVNNAGVMHAGLFSMTEMKTVREIFEVNLFSAMELTQRIASLMIRQKHGSIVNITSITAEDLGPGQCAYGASKAAMEAFTKTLAAELGNYNIRVNGVSPGITATRMAELPQAAAQREKMETKKGLFGRIASPEEISNAVLFLASEQASYINGQILRVDGGNHLW